MSKLGSWRAADGAEFRLDDEGRVRIVDRDGRQVTLSQRDLVSFADRLIAAEGRPTEPTSHRPDPAAGDLARGALPEAWDEPLARLLAASPRQRLRILESRSRWRRPALVRRALGRSRELVFAQPEQAFEVADIARLVSSVLDPREFGGASCRDLQGLSEAVVGNALRVAGRLPEAELCFFRGRLFFALGTPASAEETTAAALEVSLRRDLQQYDAALELSRAVIIAWRRRRERGPWVEALLTRATVYESLGRPAAAVPLLRRAAELDGGDHRSWIAHNLAFALARLGRRREARRVLASHGSLLKNDGSGSGLRLGTVEATEKPALAARGLWLEGLLAEEPAALLAGARRLFQRHGFALDAALVALDLALALVQRRRYDEARAVALATYRELLDRGADSEALAAWRLFGEATVAAVPEGGPDLPSRERLTGELRRVVGDPFSGRSR